VQHFVCLSGLIDVLTKVLRIPPIGLRGGEVLRY
jgi:hypothetical protein